MILTKKHKTSSFLGAMAAFPEFEEGIMNPGDEGGNSGGPAVIPPPNIYITPLTPPGPEAPTQPVVNPEPTNNGSGPGTNPNNPQVPTGPVNSASIFGRLVRFYKEQPLISYGITGISLALIAYSVTKNMK